MYWQRVLCAGGVHWRNFQSGLTLGPIVQTMPPNEVVVRPCALVDCTCVAGNPCRARQSRLNGSSAHDGIACTQGLEGALARCTVYCTAHLWKALVLKIGDSGPAMTFYCSFGSNCPPPPRKHSGR